MGLVGTAATVDAVAGWIDACAGGVAGKRTGLPNLFPAFPGFTADSPFRAEVEIRDRYSVEIPVRRLHELAAIADPARGAAELFKREVDDILSKGRPDVFVYALPSEILDLTDPRDEGDQGTKASGGGAERPSDLHDLSKALGLASGVPVQLVRPETTGIRAKRRSFRGTERRLQDNATRAWNFHVALYYKASGTPWRLAREPNELTTCYVGVSFYRSEDNRTLQTSIAEVFNERGQGVVIRGGPARTDRDDRVPHLDAAEAYALLRSALAAYRSEHRTLPAGVVLHKTSGHDPGEIDGFSRAAEDDRIDSLELI